MNIVDIVKSAKPFNWDEHFETFAKYQLAIAQAKNDNLAKAIDCILNSCPELLKEQRDHFEKLLWDEFTTWIPKFLENGLTFDKEQGNKIWNEIINSLTYERRTELAEKIRAFQNEREQIRKYTDDEAYFWAYKDPLRYYWHAMSLFYEHTGWRTELNQKDTEGISYTDETTIERLNGRAKWVARFLQGKIVEAIDKKDKPFLRIIKENWESILRHAKKIKMQHIFADDIRIAIANVIMGEKHYEEDKVLDKAKKKVGRRAKVKDAESFFAPLEDIPRDWEKINIKDAVMLIKKAEGIKAKSPSHTITKRLRTQTIYRNKLQRIGSSSRPDRKFWVIRRDWKQELEEKVSRKDYDVKNRRLYCH